MGILGTAVGAAATGLRPVAELMFIDFLGVCLDPLLNQAAKLRYMFGGKARVPLTVRTVSGAGMRSAAQHSQSLYWMTAGIPGLKTVIPSNPADAKGLLLAAIRDDDPVIFCEAKGVLMQRGEVPEGDYTIPIGQAKVVRDRRRRDARRIRRDGCGRAGGRRAARPGRHRGRGARSALAPTARRSGNPGVRSRRPAGWSSSTSRRRAAGSRATSQRSASIAASTS